MFLPLRDENPTSRFPAVTVALIALNAAVFIFCAVSPGGLDASSARFGAVPYDIVHFRSPAAAAPVPPLLTLLTSMFLHGSLFHLLGNMLYLWIFGDNVEDRLGRLRFLLFYLACGAAAGLTQVLFQAGSRLPMIGASGAIAGVLGAYAAIFPRARIRTFVFLFIYIDVVPVPAAVILGLWFLLQVLNVGLGGGVAWFAHIGGFLAGLVLARLALGKGRLRVDWRKS
ncbi:MAG TPA: rhomboid family intramembrane serine protease [Candidatus Aminicenantes bacterium]|nr:rhomboid family intramembrane serine protease [Candidatus Aminicenantes bacterium]HRY64000.1 rhomboid family intramembrane serine protease [Candidatus Aminicenantes bacterium]HRZ70913.1 rhomboid family intramembrane serine protease [Candidatus Aminicenantes bacterium]